ncbi:MAG: hypothetical protein WCL61_01245 [bacterium]
MKTKNGKYLTSYKTTPAVSELVFSRIRQAEKRQAHLEFALSYSFLFLAIILSLSTFSWIYRDASQTGLLTSLSLIFSDSGTILSYWKEFSFSIVENLPFVSLVSTLISLFILILATKNLIIVRQSNLKLHFN